MSIHTISNNEISISVNSLGAELISLKKSDREFLWQSDPSVWPRYAPVLFPIVGKLQNNEFRHEGVIYKLSQHGFARDKEFAKIAQTETSLEFELTADENTLKAYPFHFSLRILYELNGNTLAIKYKVYNPDKKELLFSIGAHPGFNCKLNDQTLNEHYLEFPNATELVGEKLKDGLLSGENYTIKLNNKRLQLSSQLFDNDALVLKNTQIEKVVLGSDRHNYKLVMTCIGWPYFGIWTKKGSDAFVCLEPWYGIADYLNSNGDLRDKEGILALPFNSEFQCEIGVQLNF